MEKPVYKLIIVDDHDILREGIRFILASTSFASIIAEARNGKEFLDILKETKIDSKTVVLMDISMPIMDGIEASREALKDFPEINIIALSMFTDKIYYDEMMRSGVKGIVLKKSGIEELKRAIETVAEGGRFYPEHWTPDSFGDNLF
ncbi:MAG: hypothetical protein CVU11_07015 [Bacteroidetes bacterium HGW-Bacteroidetes-6]|jgi:DNA-binding NarL/FixJ family response regulator|nr:MAG: hypothetical protein CVU11_07015 [Bacteroidetes bacterium HGW-Bacteroidetes-6]